MRGALSGILLNVTPYWQSLAIGAPKDLRGSRSIMAIKSP
jgi:hypothetical protein